MADRTFRSRVDVWIVALVFGGAGLPLGVAMWQLANGTTQGVLLLGGWGAMMLSVCALLTFPLRYTFRDRTLEVRSGVLRWAIDLGTVRRAALSRSPLAGPAWSLRRVRLDFAPGSFILVSPDDRESFMNELAARCPHLARNGPGLEIRPARP